MDIIDFHYELLSVKVKVWWDITPDQQKLNHILDGLVVKDLTLLIIGKNDKTLDYNYPMWNSLMLLGLWKDLMGLNPS